MISSILLLPARNDVDSPAARRALELARAAGAGIKLFATVYEPLLEGYMGSDAVAEAYAPLRRRVVNEAMAGLDELARALGKKGVRAEAEAVWSRQRHEAVGGKILADRTDLVVTELSRSAHGLANADWKLISTCPAPILLVRSPGDAPYRRIVAAVDPYHEHGKPAELDGVIVRYARELAKLAGGDVRVAHCFTPLAEFTEFEIEELPAGHAEAALEASRRRTLEQLVASEKLPAESAVLLSGRPEKALQSMAGRGEADVFVVGVASRGRLREFFIGSTAERLLSSGATDTLVLKPPGFTVSVAVNPAV